MTINNKKFSPFVFASYKLSLLGDTGSSADMRNIQATCLE
jgi:hypothetical protein